MCIQNHKGKEHCRKEQDFKLQSFSGRNGAFSVKIPGMPTFLALTVYYNVKPKDVPILIPFVQSLLNLHDRS